MRYSERRLRGNPKAIWIYPVGILQQPIIITKNAQYDYII